jgi:hypothetical protein
VDDDAQKLKMIALMLLRSVQGADLDLEVYKLVLRAMVPSERDEQVQQMLRDLRKDPEIRKTVLAKFERVREGLQEFGHTDHDSTLLGAC